VTERKKERKTKTNQKKSNNSHKSSMLSKEEEEEEEQQQNKNKNENENNKNKKKEWIRGVNIGGWLMAERFITPYLFAINTCHLNGSLCWYPGQIGSPP
jgi:hypothetical protein